MDLAGAGGHGLDLEQVADHRVVGHGSQRAVLGQRHRVVGQGAIDHRGGDDDDAANSRRGRPGQHRLGGADVAGTALGRRRGVGAQAQIRRQVHQDVDAGEAASDRRLGNVDQPPGRAGGIASAGVDGNHPADVCAVEQVAGEQQPHPARGAGDRDARAERASSCRGAP
jgi:hypothetical protein